MTDELGVGIIGINPDRGWAREAHAPAVTITAGLRLAAVASRSQSRADEAAAAVDAASAYGEPQLLIDDPAVDIVTVAASVPAHHDLIAAALAAGKHVLTEWPVTTDVGQTAALADAAGAAGLRTAVGLQASRNPALVRAAELVAHGAIGRVLHATAYSTTAGFGRVVPEGELYLEDPATGMNLPTIQFAHTLDAAQRVLGGITATGVQQTVQFPEVTVPGRDHPMRRTIADHVLLHGRLDPNSAVSVQVAGGRPADDTPFRLDVVGERGTLSLLGGAPRGFQAGRIALAVDGAPVAVDEGAAAATPDSVVNVAQIYAALRDDVRQGSATAPDFDHALALSRQLAGLLG